MVWSRSLAGLGAGYARTLVAAATAVSLALNVAHAPDRLAARGLVAALPPLALLAAVELVVSEARRALAHPGAPQRGGAASLHAAAASAAVLAAPAAPGSAATSQLRAGDWRARVRALLAREHGGGPRLTGTQVAAVVGIKPRRAQELLRELRAETSASARRSGTTRLRMMQVRRDLLADRGVVSVPPCIGLRAAADSLADPVADPASNLRIGDPQAAIAAGHGGLRADANVGDSRAVVR